jgi:cytochrome b subunit of formate dehydrogenase
MKIFNRQDRDNIREEFGEDTNRVIKVGKKAIRGVGKTGKKFTGLMTRLGIIALVFMIIVIVISGIFLSMGMLPCILGIIIGIVGAFAAVVGIVGSASIGDMIDDE